MKFEITINGKEITPMETLTISSALRCFHHALATGKLKDEMIQNKWKEQYLESLDKIFKRWNEK